MLIVKTLYLNIRTVQQNSIQQKKNHDLLKDLILDNTNKDDIVFDPCMGSGSCGIVCKELNRKFYGIELDENYFNIAKNRIDSACVIDDKEEEQRVKSDIKVMSE